MTIDRNRSKGYLKTGYRAGYKGNEKRSGIENTGKRKLTIEEISYCVGLSAAEVEQLAGEQTA